MAKKKNVKRYKESPEQRHDRVVAEAGRFRQRIVQSKKVYNRNKDKRRKDYDDSN